MASKLSKTQARMIVALEGQDIATAAGLGLATGQSSDGAACTLRSLVKRGLVKHAGHDGDGWGYQLVDAGEDAPPENTPDR